MTDDRPFVPAIQQGIAKSWLPIAEGTTDWWRTTRQFGHTPPHDGVLRLEPETALAGERLEARLTYTAGPKGIGQWGHLAVECPLTGIVAANVAVTCSDPRVVPQATVGAQGIVDVLVKGAPLREGESLTIVLGDDAKYALPPAAMATAGRHPFWAAVDAENTGVYRQVPDFPYLTVRGGAAARLRVTAPATVRAGEPFELHVVAADRQNDNPDPQYQGRIGLSCPDGDLGGSREVAVERSAGGIVCVPGLRLDTPGVYYVCAADVEGGLAGRSNPIRVLAPRTNGTQGEDGDAGLRVFWGDLHAHNEHCDGRLSIEEFYRWGRDARRLDFLALTNHVEGAKRMRVDDYWPTDQRYAREWNAPGRFVSFLAFEWGSWDQFGDKCVYYLDDDQPYYGADVEATGRPDRLWAALEAGGHRAITIPHHPRYGGPTDWRYRDDRRQPVVEICQVRGAMERGGAAGTRSVQHALAQGFRLGFVGSSDNHHGQPGNGPLAAVLAPELTREALFEALQARRCYATTGARIAVEFSVDGHVMGQEYTAERGDVPRLVTARVAGTSELRRLTVVKDNRDAYVVEPDALTAELAWTDDAPLDGTSYYYLRVEQRDGEIAWASPVWVSPPGQPGAARGRPQVNRDPQA
jgi:hypothetical protein